MKRLLISTLLFLMITPFCIAQNVGIGTTTPAATLDVNGDALINSLNIGRGGGNQITNTRVGPEALISNTTGTRNTSLGFLALHSNTSGSYNVAQGAFTLKNNISGSYNCAFGDDAMTSLTDGIANIAIGQTAFYNIISGSFNTTLGYFSGGAIISGSGNLFLGSDANATGDYSNSSAIGNQALVGASNSMVLGSINGVNGATASTKVGIGTTTPAALLDVNGDVLMNGLDIGRGGGNGITNTRIGKQALASNTSGTRNTSSGHQAMQANTTGNNNIAQGAFALKNNTTGSQNCALGDDALTANATGMRNTALGQATLYHNSAGSDNTAVGQYSGPSVISGSGNVFVGMSANSDGDYNNASAIGYRALVGASNSMVLGSINGVNGATASTKVGIGTTTPSATLDVVGTFNASAWQTASMNGDGYANMGGVLLQWGSINYNSNSPVTITFPIAFANIFSVTATVDAGNNSGSGVNVPVKVMNIGNNTFQIAGTAVFTGDNTSKIRWMAVGN